MSVHSVNEMYDKQKLDNKEFICPNCKNEVSLEKNITCIETDGQQSEYLAGFRMCPKCNWYGQPEETLEKIIEELLNPKIYFAGKISKNDWRNDLVKLNDNPSWNNIGRWDYWGIWEDKNYKKYAPQDGFIYTGPFFVSCDHGCSHGDSTHGAGENACIQFSPTKKDIFNGCIEQINDSDYVFCWIDSLDCYGTIFELGMAHNMGKKIFIGIDKELEPKKSNLCYCGNDFSDRLDEVGKGCCHSGRLTNPDDLWFVKNCGESGYYNNHQEAWKDFMDKNICKVTKEEEEKFMITLNEEELEDFKELEKRQPLSKTITFFKRNKEIVKQLKELYNNKCQICQFTFKKDNGDNYSETHHLIPLGHNGADKIENMVVLCPNCHRQLHYAKNNKYDIKYKEEHYKLLGENNAK